jgi:hypothetical protein
LSEPAKLKKASLELIDDDLATYANAAAALAGVAAWTVDAMTADAFDADDAILVGYAVANGGPTRIMLCYNNTADKEDTDALAACVDIVELIGVDIDNLSSSNFNPWQ